MGQAAVAAAAVVVVTNDERSLAAVGFAGAVAVRGAASASAGTLQMRLP